MICSLHTYVSAIACVVFAVAPPLTLHITIVLASDLQSDGTEWVASHANEESTNTSKLNYKATIFLLHISIPNLTSPTIPTVQ